MDWIDAPYAGYALGAYFSAFLVLTAMAARILLQFRKARRQLARWKPHQERTDAL